jgi:hypothetical protein
VQRVKASRSLKPKPLAIRKATKRKVETKLVVTAAGETKMSVKQDAQEFEAALGRMGLDFESEAHVCI